MSATVQTKAVADAALDFLVETSRVLTEISQERNAHAVERLLQSAAPSLNAYNRALAWLEGNDRWGFHVTNVTFEGDMGPVKLVPSFMKPTPETPVLLA